MTLKSNDIQILRSEVSQKRPLPENLLPGQPAFNSNPAEPGLYFADSTGSGLIKIGPCHVGDTAPNSSPAGYTDKSKGEFWLDTSDPGAPVLKVWGGSSWIAVSSGSSPGSISICENAGLVLSEGILCTLYNTLVPDTQLSVEVGGAAPAPASEWKSLTLIEVLNRILFPTLFPTYTLPAISFETSESGVKEIGSTISQVLSITGTKNDAGAFSSLSFYKNSSKISESTSLTPVGTTAIPSQFGFADPNNPNYTYTYQYTNSLSVTPGDTSWYGTGVYGAGLPKPESSGTLDTRAAQILSIDAPQSAYYLSSSPITVQGIYPYFWGKSSTPVSDDDIATAISTGVANKVVTSAAGSVPATFNADAEYIWFAIQGSYTTKTKWFNTSLNQGDISPTGFILPPVTKLVNSPDGYWSGIQYKIYKSAYATTTSGSIELRNS
jgi:hypothetical protein